MIARRKEGWWEAVFWFVSRTSTSSGLLSFPPPPPPVTWLVVDGWGLENVAPWLARICLLKEKKVGRWGKEELQ